MEGNIVNRKDILLLDNYNEESRKLHDSFKKAGFNGIVIVIEENGFLPNGVISLFGYYYMQGTTENIRNKPLYFDEIEIPDFWEIKGAHHSGEVFDLHKKRGIIHYTPYVDGRIVDYVNWLDENGRIVFTDFYDFLGHLYARSIRDDSGKVITKSYFDFNNKEILVENFVTKNIILKREKVTVFETKKDFVLYFIKELSIEIGRIYYNSLSTPFFVSECLPPGYEDVLFWQENINYEIPGNMKVILNGVSRRTKRIYVQKVETYQKLIEKGVNKDIVTKLGYIYSFRKNIQTGNQILICTNSDNIESCEVLVQNLRTYTFHIVAITEMSSKLTNLSNYHNVKLYPVAKKNTIVELFSKCNFYLDINYGIEIVNAIQEAFMSNLLIYSFRQTIHNQIYIPKEHIFDKDECQSLVDFIQKCNNQQIFEQEVIKQQKFAMLENVDTYKAIFRECNIKVL